MTGWTVRELLKQGTKEEDPDSKEESEFGLGLAKSERSLIYPSFLYSLDQSSRKVI